MWNRKRKENRSGTRPGNCPRSPPWSPVWWFSLLIKCGSISAQVAVEMAWNTESWGPAPEGALHTVPSQPWELWTMWPSCPLPGNSTSSLRKKRKPTVLIGYALFSPRSTPQQCLRGMVGKTAVQAYDWSLKKMSLIAKGGIVEMQILIEAQIPSEKPVYFYLNNSSFFGRQCWLHSLGKPRVPRAIETASP